MQKLVGVDSQGMKVMALEGSEAAHGGSHSTWAGPPARGDAKPQLSVSEPGTSRGESTLAELLERMLGTSDSWPWEGSGEMMV